MRPAEYGLLRTGERWHLLRDRFPMCGVPGDVIRVRLSSDVPAADRCGNCDGRLRGEGRKKKPVRKWKKPDKTVYRPKNRERFE